MPVEYPNLKQLNNAVEHLKEFGPLLAGDSMAILYTLHRHTGILDILVERERQIQEEGWDEEHDKQHDCGQLCEAAACYAYAAGDPQGSDVPIDCLSGCWPWDAEWWKPSSDSQRNLVKAGALISAEQDRLRQQTKFPPEHDPNNPNCNCMRCH